MVIRRSSGTTPSETKLAKLADKTFLNLWSYSNTYIDRKQHGKGTGNEFCDLLVVCGDDVIIFSDKSSEWIDKNDVNLSWSRWYRKAIEKSAKQIRGATGWVSKYPDRIFLDKECTEKLPIKIPSNDRMVIHGICVASGANRACAEHYGDNIGSFMIAPSVKDRGHIDPSQRDYGVFAIGDVDTDGPFIHVFDGYSLEILLYELDTVTDFVGYLRKRSILIRSGKLIFAAGEEDLVAHYLRYLGPDGEHDFMLGNGRPLRKRDQLALMDGTYEAFIQKPQYQEKKHADQISYAWDSLINTFTSNILAGTSINLSEAPANGIDAEPGLRIMALESRVSRRLLSHIVRDAIQDAVRSGKDRFFRMFMPGEKTRNRNVAYIILIMAYRPFFDEIGGYEAYRKLRAVTLEAYCLNAKLRYKKYETIVGIAFDMPIEERRSFGGSEDILAAGEIIWTEELIKYTEDARLKLDIFTDEVKQMHSGSVNEYPYGDQGQFKKTLLSRQQRRRLERAARKRR